MQTPANQHRNRIITVNKCKSGDVTAPPTRARPLSYVPVCVCEI